MSTWPGGLPQYLPIEVGQTPYDPRITTPMDVGPPKVRRRTSITITAFDTITFHLTTAQANLLDDFWKTTLEGGALPFDWDNPWPGAGTRTFRFIDLPKRIPIIGGSDPLKGLVRVSFTLLEVTVLP